MPFRNWTGQAPGFSDLIYDGSSSTVGTGLRGNGRSSSISVDVFGGDGGDWPLAGVGAADGTVVTFDLAVVAAQCEWTATTTAPRTAITAHARKTAAISCSVSPRNRRCQVYGDDLGYGRGTSASAQARSAAISSARPRGLAMSSGVGAKSSRHFGQSASLPG